MEVLPKSGVFVIVLLIEGLFFSNSVLGQTTMAHLGLNNNYSFNIDNVVGTPAASGNGLNFGNSSGPCEGGNYAYCNGSNDYLQIDINTTGYFSISISWQQKWSSTGTNRGNWRLLGDADNNGTYEYNSTITNVTANCFTASVLLPASFYNKSLVHLRIQSNVTSGNYLLLDDVTISGCSPPATPTAGNNGPICVGSTLNLNTSTVSGAVYSWTGPNSFTSALQSPTITNATIASTGTYSIIITVNGCTSTAGTTTATVNPRPVASVSDHSNISCFAGSDGTITVSASGGSSPYTFSINNGANYFPATGTDLRQFAGLQANIPYTIKLKDNNGCISN